MTAHDHRTYVEGCYRCELSRDEAMTTPADMPTPEQVLIDMRGGSWLRAQDILAALDAAGLQIVPKAERPSVCPTCGSDHPEVTRLRGYNGATPTSGCTPAIADAWHGGAE